MGANKEAELWVRSCAHDGRAFAEIFDLHKDRVFRHSFSVVGNAHDADEITAAAFFELWRKRDRVVLVDGSCLPWLIVTSGRLSQNNNRGVRRYRAMFDRLPRQSELVAAPDTEDAPSRLALSRLRVADASLVTLVAIEGFKVTEAAALLNITPGAARTRLSRAKETLRLHLDGHH